MTSEQQEDINKLTQYIRYLESLDELKMESAWYEDGRGSNRLMHIITGTGVNIEVPEIVQLHTCTDEAYQLETLQEQLKVFIDREVKRAKDRIKTIIEL